MEKKKYLQIPENDMQVLFCVGTVNNHFEKKMETRFRFEGSLSDFKRIVQDFPELFNLEESGE